MTANRFWRALWAVGVFLGLGLMAEEAEACVVTYTDYWVINGEVAADGFVEDYFDSGSCYDDAYSQWYYWEHSYDAYVSVQGPLCGDEDGDSLYSIPYGGGSGYAYVSVPTTICDVGIYTITITVTIYCNIGGNFAGEYEQAQVPVVDLKVNGNPCPVSLTREGAAVAQLDAEGTSSHSWSFDGGGNYVATETGVSQWSGPMVRSGTISVTFTLASQQLTRNCDVTVNPRSGWDTGNPPVDNDNAYAYSPSWVLSYNGASSLIIGKSTPEYGIPGFSGSTLKITAGPNEGFNYVVSGAPTFSDYKWKWARHPDLENVNAQLAKCQTGATTPSGQIISLSNIRAGIERHESSSVINSHYVDFMDANSDPQHNVGARIEARLGEPGQSLDDFNTMLNPDLTLYINELTVYYKNPMVYMEPLSAHYGASGTTHLGYLHLPLSNGSYPYPCNP